MYFVFSFPGFVFGDAQTKLMVDLVAALAAQAPAGAPPFAAVAHTLVHPPHSWPFMKAFVQEKVRAAFDKTVCKHKHAAAENAGCIVNPRLPPASFTLVR
jgi:hypothetical protein